MKKQTLFALFVITLLALTSIAGITHADPTNTEQKTPQTTPNQNNNTEYSGNAELGSQLQELINSDNFKQLTAQWRAEKATQNSRSKSEEPENTRGTITSYATQLITSSDGPNPPGTGHITLPSNILYAPDSQYTRFQTQTYRAPNQTTDEAICVVKADAPASAKIYLRGHHNGGSGTSYVYVFGANSPDTPMWDWMGIGYAHFTSSSDQDAYVATLTTAYKYLSIFACSESSHAVNDAYVDCVSITYNTPTPPGGGDDPGGGNDPGGGGNPGTPPLTSSGDVLVTSSLAPNGDTVISWVCGDDNGTNYCYLTNIYIDNVQHDPTDYGTIYAGSISFPDSNHTVIAQSKPYLYEVTFNTYVDFYYGAGPELVDTCSAYMVAWMERDGPVYCTGTNLFGGGPEHYGFVTLIDLNRYFICTSMVSYKWDGTNQTEHIHSLVSYLDVDIYTYVGGTTVDIYFEPL